MKRILGIALILLLGCSKPDEWTAFVYPNIDNMPGPEQSENYIIGKFESFETCQIGAIDRMRVNQSQTGKQGAYVCGLNCTHNKDFGNLLVCKEKRK
jgi:hypothetical protein